MFPRLFPCRSGLTWVAPILIAGLVAGCGGDGTYRVSGKVTFNGQPVPAGKIYFIADGSKGNTGPTGFADIKNGSYDTSESGGQGAPAGPVIIAVEGIDPSGPPPKADPSGEVTAKVLFPRYETTADMPKSASTKDIEVPAAAAKGPSKPAGGQDIIIP
jgi:hypothetical protein